MLRRTMICGDVRLFLLYPLDVVAEVGDAEFNNPLLLCTHRTEDVTPHGHVPRSVCRH